MCRQYQAKLKLLLGLGAPPAPSFLVLTLVRTARVVSQPELKLVDIYGFLFEPFLTFSLDWKSTSHACLFLSSMRGGDYLAYACRS
jgi:hypothetical protein